MSPSKQRLIIRADASVRMGTGHAMRCVSLAQAWRHNDGDVIFAMAASTPAMERRIVREGFVVEHLECVSGSPDDAEATALLAKTVAATWIVVDGYQFGADFQRIIKDAGFMLLVFDDYGHARSYSADIVLNQNLGADEKWYADRAQHTRLLLGTKYALLREQFSAWRNWKREIPAVARKVLVTLGGSDPDNVTGKVIDALQGLDIEAKIVVGGSNPHLEPLKSQISKCKTQTPSLRFELIVDASDMPELMSWADVAVVACGSTVWEIAFMGLPCFALVLADNQTSTAQMLTESRIAETTGCDGLARKLEALIHDQSGRMTMSRDIRNVCDSLGSLRVMREMLRSEAGATMDQGTFA
jgi:UDP-2,4-diacetamido-2,4,6-trideoxy-beta-L-altropyranose hydrolase